MVKLNTHSHNLPGSSPGPHLPDLQFPNGAGAVWGGTQNNSVNPALVSSACRPFLSCPTALAGAGLHIAAGGRANLKPSPLPQFSLYQIWSLKVTSMDTACTWLLQSQPPSPGDTVDKTRNRGANAGLAVRGQHTNSDSSS